jgi:hypothetical protein
LTITIRAFIQNSILYHSSLYHFSCQYHSIFVNVPPHYRLNWGGVIPPALILLLTIALVIWDLLCVHMLLKRFFCIQLRFWHHYEKSGEHSCTGLFLSVLLHWSGSVFSPVQCEFCHWGCVS